MACSPMRGQDPPTHLAKCPQDMRRFGALFYLSSPSHLHTGCVYHSVLAFTVLCRQDDLVPRLHILQESPSRIPPPHLFSLPFVPNSTPAPFSPLPSLYTLLPQTPLGKLGACLVTYTGHESIERGCSSCTMHELIRKDTRSSQIPSFLTDYM
jgi:hypothetical protein